MHTSIWSIRASLDKRAWNEPLCLSLDVPSPAGFLVHYRPAVAVTVDAGPWAVVVGPRRVVALVARAGCVRGMVVMVAMLPHGDDLLVVVVFAPGRGRTEAHVGRSVFSIASQDTRMYDMRGMLAVSRQPTGRVELLIRRRGKIIGSRLVANLWIVAGMKGKVGIGLGISRTGCGTGESVGRKPGIDSTRDGEM